MTKEAIVNKFEPYGELLSTEQTISCMEYFAKQEAIEFLSWHRQQDMTSKPASDLYQLFLEQKQK